MSDLEFWRGVSPLPGEVWIDGLGDTVETVERLCAEVWLLHDALGVSRIGRPARPAELSEVEAFLKRRNG